MSSNFRWRWGETNPVIANVDSNTTISIGDLLWMDPSAKTVKPASAMTYSGSAANGQTQLTSRFIGVAMQASPAGSDAPIRIATSGTFQFDKYGANVRLGNLVGATNGGAGNKLSDQAVTRVTDKAGAIGRVTHIHNVEAGSVYVSILSTVVHGGVSGTVMEYGSGSSN